jgi:hypothetical protein
MTQELEIKTSPLISIGTNEIRRNLIAERGLGLLG